MSQNGPVNLLLCSVPEDEPYRRAFISHLRPLQQQGLVAIWSTQDIPAGTDRTREIARRFEQASIILLLVSVDFLVAGQEMARALQRHRAGKARAVAVLIRPCNWRDQLEGDILVLPTNLRPITLWDDKDEAWSSVVPSISLILREASSRDTTSGIPETVEKKSPSPQARPQSPFKREQTYPVPPPAEAAPSGSNTSSRISIPAVVSAPARRSALLSRLQAMLLVALALLLIFGATSTFIYRAMSQANDRIQQATAATSAAFGATATTRANPTATITAAFSAYENAMATNGTMFGFDAQHTHLNPYEHILTTANVSKLALDWVGATGQRITDGGVLVSSPIVANGMVYAGSYSGELYAFNAAGCGRSSCPPLWTASTRGIIFPSLAIANGIVYAGSFDHNLYAFKAAGCGSSSCSPLWTAAVQGTIISSPTIANSKIYVGSDDHNLYVFNAAGCGSSSCSPLWMATTGDFVESSPAVSNKIVYVGSLDHKLYAFDATGCGKSVCTPLWTAPTGDAISSSPAVNNDVVYVGSDDGKLYAFAAFGCGSPSCTPLWTASTQGPVIASPAISDNIVYVGSKDDDLYAFNAFGCNKPSCTPLWKATTKDAIISSATIANGVVYVGSLDHNLYAFDAAGCGGPVCSKPLWSYATPASVHASPAVANGWVYCMSYDSDLYAFRLRTLV